MDSVLGYLVAGLAAVIVAARVRAHRGGASAPGSQQLTLAVGAFGMSAALTTPITLAAAMAIEPWPNLTRLVANSLSVIAAGAVWHVLLVSLGTTTTRITRHWAVLWFVLGLMAVTFTAADTAPTERFLEHYGHLGFVTVYQVVHLGYMAIALSCVAWLLHRYSNHHELSVWARHGLRLASLSPALGMLWVSWKAAGTLVVRTSGSTLPHQAFVSQLLASGAIAVGVVAVGVSTWDHRGRAQLVNLRVRVLSMSLYPLWRTLTRLVPHVLMDVTRARDEEDLPRADAAVLRLYRRVVEIRDAQRVLRAYVPPGAVALAQTMTRRCPLLRRRYGQNMHDAAELMVSIAVYRRRLPEPTVTAAPRAAADADTDLFEEAAQLARLGRALAHPLVLWTRMRMSRARLISLSI